MRPTLTNKLFANDFEWHLLCCIAPSSYVMVVKGNSNIFVGVVCASVVLDTGHQKVHKRLPLSEIVSMQ